MEAKSVRIHKEHAERTEDGRLKASCTMAEEEKEVVSNRTELSCAACGGVVPDRIDRPFDMEHDLFVMQEKPEWELGRSRKTQEPLNSLGQAFRTESP